MKILAILMALFIVPLLLFFLIQGNLEFTGYGIGVSFLVLLVFWLNEKYKFPQILLWLFSIMIVLHFLGGIVYIGGTRLYDLMLINLIGEPYFILKFDQAFHTFCYFIVAIIAYYILRKHAKKSTRYRLMIFAVLIALGVSLLTEMLEFVMVIVADAAEAVGGYYNTALDLVSNLIGAVLGAIYVRTFIDKR